jgi:hypothetical protein
MLVDEARGDHMAGGVDLAAAGQVLRRDRDDATVLDAHIGDLVEPRLGIHHPAAFHDEVEGLRSLRQPTRSGRRDGGNSKGADVHIAPGQRAFGGRLGV